MALWTPYAQEIPLDLTKRVVKSERNSPIPGTSAPFSPVMPEYYRSQTDTQQYSYQYQPGSTYTVPTVSPDSIGSWSYIKPNESSPLQSESHELFETESLSEDIEYQAFERDAMHAMAERNGGTLLGNNPRMRRAVQTSQEADDSYRKQRERNNFAAKQSRDRRKLREVRLAFQVTYLKKKMVDLKARLAAGVCGRCRHVR